MIRIGVLSAVIVSVVGCGVSTVDVETTPAPLSYEEFLSRTFLEPDTGVRIWNGDEILEDELQTRLAYESVIARGAPIGSRRDSLIVNRFRGADDAWPAATAQNLTYCISSSSFGARYDAVVAAMNSAAAAWEGAANVNFVHDASQDGSCGKRSNVVFKVRQVCIGQYLARAFFPSSRVNSREILIDCTSFGDIAPWTLTGILRHELGHTIGFRHEHTRPESGTCFEDNSWRALTSYDASSVMHYPQCNGTNQTGDLTLTALDQSGARSLYP